MTTGEFADLVSQMRRAQKAYFRTRTSSSLRESKELEKQVDKILLERENRQNQKQRELF